MATQVIALVILMTVFLGLIARSSTYKISTYDPEVIRINLGNKRLVKETVPLNSKLLIKCNFDTPIWYKNGKAIPTDNRRAKSLKFNAIKRTDAGYYSCGSEFSEWSNLTLSVFSQHEAADHYQSDSPGSGAGGGGGGGSSASTTRVANLEKKSLFPAASPKNSTPRAPLEIVDNDLTDGPPEFVVGSKDQVTSVTRKAGDSYKLKCEVAGEPKFRISWIKDDRMLNTKVGNKSSVLLHSLDPEDSGVYVCKACNANGCVNSTTKLDIEDNPEEPFIQYNNMESHSQLSDSEEPDSPDYVDDDHHYQDYEETDDEEENEEDTGVADQHGGPAGETTETQPAVVVTNGELRPGPPFFTKREHMVGLMPKPSGNMVRLRCPADGNPMPNITWTKDNQKIVRSMGSVKYAKWSIVLEDLVPKDSGAYTCNVCNDFGCVSFTTKLEVKDRVNHKPIITKSLTNITAVAGSNVSMECKVLSDLTKIIQWVKFKGFCAECAFIKNKKRDSDNPEVLNLENVTHADEGWYTCVAANTLGASYESAYLRVVDEFPEDDTPTAHPVRPHSTLITIMTTVLSGCFMILAIIVVIVCKKLKREKMKHRAMEHVNQWTKKVIVLKQPPIENSIPGVTEAMQMPIVRIEKQRSTLVQSGNCDPTLISEYEFPIDLNWEFQRSKLALGKNLGEGAFGKVVMAEAQGLVKGQTSTVVAVKMLKEGHTDADVKDLVCEMEVMKMIGKHVNIINLLGCCCKDGPLYVIVEYAPHGNLKDFLRSHRFGTSMYEDSVSGEKEKKILTLKELISFAYQIARGMEHLASRRCIHRDLAARNVLVSDGFVMKIADFGLARDIHSQEYYRKTTTGKLPIRWMAPESLEEKFYDSQSDVWSFGVLLWEIMTLGGNPYSSIPTWDNLLEHLKKGKRLEQPPLCPIHIYVVMRECWNYKPKVRPTFSELVQNLDRLVAITSNEEYLDLGLPTLETPPSSDDDDDDESDDNDGCERMRMYPFNHSHTTESTF
ncbi:fibroblast growth factor receptor homolog 1-like isoform X2 [Topomyia yanbarensis]|uniref:fibroblast growth factor receptor homolog 1-like isoform X2 n=1 Tax=Topomyia yanbarensis TaxID=2498891 RepID=UPI00273B269B|nr:fibroblast growth factor receptor homolog 1-like isoform X2 [Topomyia yanbarensis]